MTDGSQTLPLDDMLGAFACLTEHATTTANQLHKAISGPDLANDATRPVGEWLHAIAIVLAARAEEAHSVISDWQEAAINGPDYPYPTPSPELVAKMKALREEVSDDEFAAAFLAIAYPKPGYDA